MYGGYDYYYQYMYTGTLFLGIVRQYITMHEYYF